MLTIKQLGQMVAKQCLKIYKRFAQNATLAKVI